MIRIEGIPAVAARLAASMKSTRTVSSSHSVSEQRRERRKTRKRLPVTRFLAGIRRPPTITLVTA